jgi:hypothetical protein
MSPARTPFSVPGDSMPAWPTPDEDAQLLRGLLTGRITATADFAEAYYHRLFERLQRMFPNTDPDWIYDAVAETYEMITEDPAKYDPKAGRLGTFLLISAKRDLLNRFDKENRHRSRRNFGIDVELLPGGGKGVGGELETVEEAAMAVAGVLSVVTDGLTAEEMAGLDLVIERERSTAAFVLALKLEHLPPEERERAVKRFKDKIKVRIKRARGLYDEAS